MTGIAYDALVQLAEEEYPAYPVTFSDGVTVRLRSSLDLNDAETAELGTLQEELSALDESSNVAALRNKFLEALVLVSDNPETAKERFDAAPLKVLVVLFKEWQKDLADASKSEGSAPSAG